jgi:hypothetical protein
MQFGGNGATSGRESGFCITITHRTAHRLLCSDSFPRKAFLSSPSHHSPDLAPNEFWLFPTLKMGLNGDAFYNRGGHQIECDGRTPEDSKEAFRRCFQQWQDRWSKCVCVCVCVCVWAGKGPTLKVIR